MVTGTTRRYQVFVSSTYVDLIEERQEVMRALLESECIPAGMELFPAADEDAWSLIKRVIDECDYYILILGGRYGSSGPDGIGYTEMEYRYALEMKKPIVSFVHEDTGSIPASKTDRDDKARQRLEDFRRLVQRKLTKTWATPAELAAVVGRSIEKLKKEKPAEGWVRGGALQRRGEARELAGLRAKVKELAARLEAQDDAGERPEVLVGSTYMVKTPVSDVEYYITVNDVILNEGKKNELRRPYEVLMSTRGGMVDDPWVVALSRLVSMDLRSGADYTVLIKELKSVHDARGGYWQGGGKFMPSIVAELGYVLEKHLMTIGLFVREN